MYLLWLEYMNRIYLVTWSCIDSNNDTLYYDIVDEI